MISQTEEKTSQASELCAVDLPKENISASLLMPLGAVATNPSSLQSLPL